MNYILRKAINELYYYRNQNIRRLKLPYELILFRIDIIKKTRNSPFL